MDGLVARFRETFFAVVQANELADELKQAASAAKLGAWTRALTEAAIRTCTELELKASAKGHKLELLPIHRSEYLALDVMAFAEGEKRWRFPSAVMELESAVGASGPAGCILLQQERRGDPGLASPPAGGGRRGDGPGGPGET